MPAARQEERNVMARNTRIVRKVVHIDEERCNGCGVCIPACAEGALQIVDGKARLIGDRYCDGLGACLGECPEGAITIEEREAEEFQEPAVECQGHDSSGHGHAAGAHGQAPHGHSHAAGTHGHGAGGHGHPEPGSRQAQGGQPGPDLPCGCPSSSVMRLERQEAEPTLACGCPSSSVTRLEGREAAAAPAAGIDRSPQLSHWPVQLTLVPPTAPFLKDADVVLTADCVPFAYSSFHQDFLKDHAVIVACPKLDDFQAHLSRLTEIVRRSGLRSVTAVRMEVPCCSGLTHMAEEAIRRSGRDVPLDEVVIGIKGSRLT